MQNIYPTPVKSEDHVAGFVRFTIDAGWVAMNGPNFGDDVCGGFATKAAAARFVIANFG